MIPGFIDPQKVAGGLTNGELIAADVCRRSRNGLGSRRQREDDQQRPANTCRPKCVAEMRALSLPVALKAPTMISATKTVAECADDRRAKGRRAL